MCGAAGKGRGVVQTQNANTVPTVSLPATFNVCFVPAKLMCSVTDAAGVVVLLLLPLLLIKDADVDVVAAICFVLNVGCVVVFQM